jgi:hypothetical protein
VKSLPEPTFRTETALQQAIVKALSRRGHWVIRTGVVGKHSSRGSRIGEPGLPDIHLLETGSWLEIKLPGRPLSADQKRWHANAKQLGVNVWTVDTISEALEVADRWLQESGVSREALFRVDRDRRRKA